MAKHSNLDMKKHRLKEAKIETSRRDMRNFERMFGPTGFAIR